MRLALAILLSLGLCATAAAEKIPLPPIKPPIPAKPLEPRSFGEAAAGYFDTRELTREPSECRKRLDVLAVVDAMPRLIGPGVCGGVDMVEVHGVRLPDGRNADITPAPVLRCEMAEAFASWVRNDVAARVSMSGAKLKSVQTYDDYSCRGRNRVFGAKISEHGKGNAVDVRSLTFTNGKIVMLHDVKVEKEFRSAMRQSACSIFSTVLGPGSDGAHEEHIHLDLIERRGGYRMCQWDVREPPPPVVAQAIPLPRPRPPEIGGSVGGKL